MLSSFLLKIDVATSICVCFHMNIRIVLFPMKNVGLVYRSKTVFIAHLAYT